MFLTHSFIHPHIGNQFLKLQGTESPQSKSESAMDQSGKKVPEAQSRIFDEAEARNAAGGDVGFMSSLTNDRLQQQQGQM